MTSLSTPRIFHRTTIAAALAASIVGTAALAVPNGWTSYAQIGPPPIDPPSWCFYHELYSYPGSCPFVTYSVWQRTDCSLELICRTSQPVICPCTPPGPGWRPFQSAATNSFHPIDFPVYAFDWTAVDASSSVDAVVGITVSSLTVFNLDTGASVAEYPGADAGSTVSIPTASLASDLPYAIVGISPDGRMQGYSAFSLKGAPREVERIAFDVTWSDGAFGTPVGQLVAYTGDTQAGIVSQFADLSILTEVTTHNANACAGDFNADAVVDDLDFVAFVPAYNTLLCDDPAMIEGCPADLTGDGAVDDSDFAVFVRSYTALVCP